MQRHKLQTCAREGALILVDSKGKKWADILPDEIRAVGGNGSRMWNRLLNIDPPLMKDHKYTVDNNFIFDTDELGRVNKITIENVEINPRLRNEEAQRHAKNVKDGKPGDHGGHMARAQWNGPSEQINYFPQDAVQNRSGDWYQMEELVSQLRRDNPSLDNIIRVEIYPSFRGDSKRPYEFVVEVTLNGELVELPLPVIPNP